MNVRLRLVRMEQHVMMGRNSTPVTVQLSGLEHTVKTV